jgi:hypothetical protein
MGFCFLNRKKIGRSDGTSGEFQHRQAPVTYSIISDTQTTPGPVLATRAGDA